MTELNLGLSSDFLPKDGGGKTEDQQRSQWQRTQETGSIRRGARIMEGGTGQRGRREAKPLEGGLIQSKGQKPCLGPKPACWGRAGTLVSWGG